MWSAVIGFSGVPRCPQLVQGVLLILYHFEMARCTGSLYVRGVWHVACTFSPAVGLAQTPHNRIGTLAHPLPVHGSDWLSEPYPPCQSEREPAYQSDDQSQNGTDRDEDQNGTDAQTDVPRSPLYATEVLGWSDRFSEALSRFPVTSHEPFRILSVRRTLGINQPRRILEIETGTAFHSSSSLKMIFI